MNACSCVLSLAVLSVGALGAPLASQQRDTPDSDRLGLSVSGVTIQARGTTVLEGNREVITGSWSGVAVELRLGLLVFEGVGASGTMTASENTLALSREGGEMRGTGRLELARWLWIEGGYAVRAFNSPAGYQRWLIPAGGLAIAPPLGHESLRAHVRVHYLPEAQIEAQATVKQAIAAEVGLTARPPRVPLIARVVYRVERYDFPAAASRIEQFDALQLSAGLRLGR